MGNTRRSCPPVVIRNARQTRRSSATKSSSKTVEIKVPCSGTNATRVSSKIGTPARELRRSKRKSESRDPPLEGSAGETSSKVQTPVRDLRRSSRKRKPSGMAMSPGDYGQLGLNQQQSVSTPGGPGSVGLQSTGGPMSNIPMTPSPAAPLSNAPLMTPSPAPQTSMYNAMIATPSPAVAPSPAGPTSVQPPGSVGNPGSHFQPSPLPPSSVGPSSVGRPSGDFVATTRPIATDTKTFTKICRKRKASGKSPLEEFLSAVFTMKQYERGLSKEPQMYADLKASPGLLHFTTNKSVSFEIAFSGVEECRITLRLSIIGNECAITQDDIPMLERYFLEKVTTLESYSALQTFCRILSQTNRPVCRSFINLMEDELNGNPNAQWKSQLLMVSPVQSSTTIPGRFPSVAGGPGVRYNKEQTSALFYVRLHAKEPKAQSTPVPVIALVYDFNQRNLQLYGMKADAPEQIKFKEIIEVIQRNSHMYANKKTECCIWPAVSELKRNLTWPPGSVVPQNQPESNPQ